MSVVDLELGAELDNDEFWERLLGNLPKPIGIAGPRGKGGTGGTLIRMPREFMRDM